MAKRTKKNNFKDTDKDGLSDKAEQYFGTDPNNPDTDGDGMSDRDEVVRGRNPLGPGMLRDFFIPHAGNNYHPRSLHPKRVLFHAGSVLAVKALVVVFMLMLPATAWLSPDVLREQQQKIITLTNAVRDNLGVGSLAENTLLTQSALAKAQDMLIGQYFAHASPDGARVSNLLGDAGYSYRVAGENLAMGFADAESVVNAWVASPTHYANIIEPEYRDIGVGLVSGLYSGHDTTLVAQHFGAPYIPLPILTDIEAVPLSLSSLPPVEPAESAGEPDSERALGEQEYLEVDEDTAPVLSISVEESKVYVAEDEQGGATIVRAQARVTGALEATVLFNNNRIELTPSSEDGTWWTGSTIIFETDEIQVFNPVVLPALYARAADGTIITEDISWDNIVPVKPSLTSQYFFMRQQDSGVIHSLLTASSLYFKLLLGLVIISLMLMVFIEIRKQHPKHIASGLGFVALLLLAIML